MRFHIECDCGDIINAENKDEAIKLFCKKHNFPLPNSFQKRNDYAEEYKIEEVDDDYNLY